MQTTAKQLAEDNKQRDELTHKSDNFKFEIKKAMNELSSQLIFQCKYKQAESDNFKGKITL
jgi:hypothetical protein